MNRPYRTLTQIGRDVITEDGGAIYVADKGEQFDCKRCWRVVTLRAPRFPTSKALMSPGSGSRTSGDDL